MGYCIKYSKLYFERFLEKEFHWFQKTVEKSKGKIWTDSFSRFLTELIQNLQEENELPPEAVLQQFHGYAQEFYDSLQAGIVENRCPEATAEFHRTVRDMVSIAIEKKGLMFLQMVNRDTGKKEWRRLDPIHFQQAEDFWGVLWEYLMEEGHLNRNPAMRGKRLLLFDYKYGTFICNQFLRSRGWLKSLVNRLIRESGVWVQDIPDSLQDNETEPARQVPAPERDIYAEQTQVQWHIIGAIILKVLQDYQCLHYEAWMLRCGNGGTAFASQRDTLLILSCLSRAKESIQNRQPFQRNGEVYSRWLDPKVYQWSNGNLTQHVDVVAKNAKKVLWLIRNSLGRGQFNCSGNLMRQLEKATRDVMVNLEGTDRLLMLYRKEWDSNPQYEKVFRGEWPRQNLEAYLNHLLDDVEMLKEYFILDTESPAPPSNDVVVAHDLADLPLELKTRTNFAL